jgi:hypothetical protein
MHPHSEDSAATNQGATMKVAGAIITYLLAPAILHAALRPFASHCSAEVGAVSDRWTDVEWFFTYWQCRFGFWEPFETIVSMIAYRLMMRIGRLPTETRVLR